LIAATPGNISDEELEARGFPIDLDMNAKQVRREAGITQEPYQRAKCLSHKVQMRLRSERIQEAQARELEKTALKNTRIQLQLESSKVCEDKVLAEMGIKDSDRNEPTSKLLRNAQLEHFKGCCVPQLKAFCRVR
jgi:hypothetical protein